jgi:hypothetical protein
VAGVVLLAITRPSSPSPHRPPPLTSPPLLLPSPFLRSLEAPPYATGRKPAELRASPVPMAPDLVYRPGAAAFSYPPSKPTTPANANASHTSASPAPAAMAFSYPPSKPTTPGVAAAAAAAAASPRVPTGEVDPLTQPPHPLLRELNPFQRLLLIRCLQPRGFVAAARAAVREYLGPACVVTEQLLDFDAIFAITESSMPIVLISSTDHTLPFLQQFADGRGINTMHMAIGRGQGAATDRLIRSAVGASRRGGRGSHSVLLAACLQPISPKPSHPARHSRLAACPA